MASRLQSRPGTVTLLRTRLATIFLLAAVLTATAAPLLAASARPVCSMKHHACGHRAEAGRCCCVIRSDGPAQNGPVEARVELRVDLVAIRVVNAADAPSAPAARLDHPRAFPPGAAPPDLVTLFSTLLI